jgi:primosomal protein N'
MPESFITLQCRNCNGKLDVYDDMERFACGYCGTEVVVQRRGGTIVLKAVTEAIKRVEIGTEKTAAELAITRYEIDLNKLRQKEEKGLGSGLGFAMFAILVGVAFAWWGENGIGWTVVVIGAVMAGLLLFGNFTALERTQSQIRRLEAQIAEKRRIADGCP